MEEKTVKGEKKRPPKQCARIAHNEALFDEIGAAAKRLSEAIAAFEELQPKIGELTAYYESKTWKKDFADDEAGRLPADLKRGVLSEDGVYELLGKIGELNKRIGNNR